MRFSTILLACLATLMLPALSLAGYINFSGFHPDEFTTLGTAWDPGPNAARLHTPGFPAPGGATWSVIGSGVAAAANDPHGGNLTTLLTSLYVGGVDEITTLGLALDKWAAVSGFTNLGMVTDGGGAFGANGPTGVTGDIRVAAIFIDGAMGSNVLAHAWQPLTEADFGSGWNIGGDTHFDNSNSWSDGGGGGTIDFHTVALHEFGHALGLGHSSVAGSVMEPIYAGVRRTLHADDIAGIQAIYGPDQVNAVPEPTSLALCGIGACLTCIRVRRRRHRTVTVD
jgi:hypothetical protein